MRFRPFIRLRCSSTDGKQYFAVAKELPDLDLFDYSIEIKIDNKFYTVKAYVDYDKKIVVYCGHSKFQHEDKITELNEFKKNGWFELSPGDPELPPRTTSDTTVCTCGTHPGYCEVHAA